MERGRCDRGAFRKSQRSDGETLFAECDSDACENTLPITWLFAILAGFTSRRGSVGVDKSTELLLEAVVPDFHGDRALNFIRKRRFACQRASRLLASLLVILVFVNKCQCSEEPILYNVEDLVADFILCRECGADVVDAGFIINKLSPEAIVLKNRTIFDREAVDVQFLTNPRGLIFHTITLSTASCFSTPEKWTSHFTWYPGYAWKTCFCRHCGHFLGWMFEPIKTATKDRLLPTEDGFYLLILGRLLSEKFANSLIVVPKSYRS